MVPPTNGTVLCGLRGACLVAVSDFVIKFSQPSRRSSIRCESRALGVTQRYYLSSTSRLSKTVRPGKTETPDGIDG
jgi:hypothetical protein